MSNSLYWNGDIVWISSKDMKSSRISGSELKITNLALNEMTLYHPGTLLLVARSGILKHSLPLAILEVDATINQDIKALQVHGCNAFYLYYAILSQEDNIIRTLVKTGTTVQSLMMDSFLNIEIASELQPSTGQAPTKNSAPEPTPPQPPKELQPGDKVYVAGFGWVEYEGPNHCEDGADIYENGNKIGIMG